MDSFRDWLARVLADGDSVQDGPPALPADRAPLLADLRAAFERHALEVAGPPLPFDPDAALAGAVALARACWLLVAGEGEPPAMKSAPQTPAAHLSADVCLRFLPAVLRRARARHAEGEPAASLDRLLRAWPLSGVLADLDGEPAAPPDFGGHPGLQLLYAERLVATGRPGWVPADGPTREWAERVFAERGRLLPAPPTEGSARE
jgi:hypothetical protein